MPAPQGDGVTRHGRNCPGWCAEAIEGIPLCLWNKDGKGTVRGGNETNVTVTVGNKLYSVC